MCTRIGTARPGNTAEALALLHTALDHLTACGPSSLPAATQAEALISLERASARQIAARTRILGAFSASRGFEADGQFGAGNWLRAFTGVTPPAARGAMGWVRRLEAHPLAGTAMAAGKISESL